MINRVTSSLCPRYTVRRTLGSLSTNKSMSAARKSPPVLAPSYRSLQIEFTFPIKKKRKWNVINSFELALQYYSQNRKSVFLQYGLPSEFYDNNNIRYIICMIVLRRKCHGFDESAHSTKTYMTILVIHCIFTYIGKIEI